MVGIIYPPPPYWNRVNVPENLYAAVVTPVLPVVTHLMIVPSIVIFSFDFSQPDPANMRP